MYRFVYYDSKHVEDIMDYMEEEGIDRDHVTDAEYEEMKRHMNGVMKHFEQV